jgi:hypothetical protein
MPPVPDNTNEVFEAVVGLTVERVLFDALPLRRDRRGDGDPDERAGGTITLVFDDGSGLTVHPFRGEWWRDDHDDIRRAGNRVDRERGTRRRLIPALTKFDEIVGDGSVREQFPDMPDDLALAIDALANRARPIAEEEAAAEETPQEPS